MSFNSENKVLHYFPLSGTYENVFGFEVEGMLSLYNYAIRNTELSGPTYFS